MTETAVGEVIPMDVRVPNETLLLFNPPPAVINEFRTGAIISPVRRRDSLEDGVILCGLNIFDSDVVLQTKATISRPCRAEVSRVIDNVHRVTRKPIRDSWFQISGKPQVADA